jgi:hypothetical protein
VPPGPGLHSCSCVAPLQRPHTRWFPHLLQPSACCCVLLQPYRASARAASSRLRPQQSSRPAPRSLVRSSPPPAPAQLTRLPVPAPPPAAYAPLLGSHACAASRAAAWSRPPCAPRQLPPPAPACLRLRRPSHAAPRRLARACAPSRPAASRSHTRCLLGLGRGEREGENRGGDKDGARERCCRGEKKEGRQEEEKQRRRRKEIS